MLADHKTHFHATGVRAARGHSCELHRRADFVSTLFDLLIF
jgi:hypothetical protein